MTGDLANWNIEPPLDAGVGDAEAIPLGVPL
jgi:hypothetical protein